MPKVNGTEAIAYFRSQFPFVPIVVLTGQPDLAGATSLLKHGVADDLVKPVEPANLIAAVGKVAANAQELAAAKLGRSASGEG